MKKNVYCVNIVQSLSFVKFVYKKEKSSGKDDFMRFVPKHYISLRVVFCCFICKLLKEHLKSTEFVFLFYLTTEVGRLCLDGRYNPKIVG
jgi:phage-related holin